jgi:futalosine hydrolase
MRILLVAATESEIASFSAMLEKFNTVAPYKIEIFTTGVGIPATILKLSQKLGRHHYDLIFNVGIAGAIADSLLIPSLVWVMQDEFYELGAEDHDEFISVFDLGMADKNDFPFRDGVLQGHDLPHFVRTSAIKELSGITVMRVHGNAESIARLKRLKQGVAVETMEGAAVFYTAAAYSIPCIQLRAISNRVEPRNRVAWKIGEAVEMLNNQLMQWFIIP